MARVYDKSPHQFEPGDYGRWKPYTDEDDLGMWFCRVPSSFNMGGNLTRHEVTEHEDGTITVSPSILVSTVVGDALEEKRWHGYLVAGQWTTLPDTNVPEVNDGS